MNNTTTLITEFSAVLIKLAPAIILFFVGVIVLYGFRDVIEQWFYGWQIKLNRQYNEMDKFEIDKEPCVLVRINSIRVYFLALDENNKLTERSISLPNKKFMQNKIIKLGRFI